MGVVQIETFDVDVTSEGQTHTLTNTLPATTSAFVRNTNPRGHSGGPVGSTGNSGPDDMSGYAYVSSTSQITLGRQLGTHKMVGEVWRYTGAASGIDEFIVRGQYQVTLTTAGPSTTSLAGAGIVDRNKCIPFITGKTCTQASQNNMAEMGAIAYLDASGDLVVERGTGTTTLVVYVTVVEFTGSNWTVGYCNTGALATGSRSVYLDSRGNTGTLADIDWAASFFVEVRQSGGNGTNDAIEDMSFCAEPNTASTISVTKDSTAANTGSGFIHVLQNPSMSVVRETQNITIPNNNSYRSEPFPSITLSDVNEACIEWTVFSDGTGTAHGRGSLCARLTNATTLQSWVHRSGNSGTYRYGVIDLANVSNTPPVTITSAPTQIDVGDTNLVILGSNFEAVQGTGQVYVSDTNSVGSGTDVTQSIDSWSDTSIQFDADLTGLADGIVYIIVVNDSGGTRAWEANKGVAPYEDVIGALSNLPDHYHTFNNTYSDEIGGLAANSQASAGTQGFFTDPLTRGRTHSWGVTGTGSRIEMTDSQFTNVTNTHRRRFICGWFRFPSTPLSPQGIWEEGGNVNNIYMVIGFGGKLLCNVADSSNGFKLQAFSDFLLSPNRVYHIGLLFDGDLGCRCYIDGVLQSGFDGAAPNSDQATHSGDYAYGAPDGSLDTGGTDITYPSFSGSRYNDWATWSDAGNDMPSATDIRVELFEKGAIEEVEILGDTEVNMQLAIDALSGNNYDDVTFAIKINKPSDVAEPSFDFDNITFGDRTSIQVQWMGSGGNTLTITNLNGSNVVASSCSTPYGGVISVVNPATLTLTGLQTDTEVRVYEAGTTTEIGGIESSGTSFATSVLVSSVDIVVHALGYLNIRLESVSISGDTTLPIQQRIDRQYENP